MHKRDIDTVTNLILNNEYKLHEDEPEIKREGESNKTKSSRDEITTRSRNNREEMSNITKKDIEGISNRQIKEREGVPTRTRREREGVPTRTRREREGVPTRTRREREGVPTRTRIEREDVSTRTRGEREGVPTRKRREREGVPTKTRIEREEISNRTRNNRNGVLNKTINNKELSKNKEEILKHQKINKKGKHKKEKNIKQKLILLIKILFILILLGIIFIYLFFKTSLFQKYKEIWVETAMSTMNHQYLATWFLSDEEIREILDSLKVVNEEDSNSNEIIIEESVVENEKEEKEEIIVEKIKGKNYVGHVLIIPNPAKVKLVDTRKTNRGTQLSEILRNKNAIAGINAGGFTDDGGVGQGHQLCKVTIINQKLLYGNKNTKYSLIGLSSDHKLVLGKYTYQEAISAGIESAVEFGPYLIVNGKNQVTNSNSGGIHPRTAIGQRRDGTFIFVVVDGRQPGYSLGTNLLELQNIFNRYDAYNAANLDGGSSSTMCYDGKRINKTSTPMGERYLPNAFIVEK